MLMPSKIIIVSELASKQAVLKVNAPEARTLSLMVSLGFDQVDGVFKRPITDQTDRHHLISALIEAGALFVGGPGWSPAEVVGYLREQGLLNENFKRIVWKSPQEYLIEQC